MLLDRIAQIGRLTELQLFLIFLPLSSKHLGDSLAICYHDDVVALEEADEAEDGVCLRHLPDQTIPLLLLGHELVELAGLQVRHLGALALDQG